MVIDQDTGDSDENASWDIHLRTWIPVIVVGILMWLYFREDRLCSAAHDVCYLTWIVYTAFISMFIMLSQAYYTWMKYKSPQFIGNNIHGSITGRRPVSAGSFFLLKLGGIDYGITVDGKEGTVIFPQETYNRSGSQVHSPCRFAPVTIDKLDPLVRTKIHNSNFPKPYFLGIIDEDQYDIDISDEEMDAVLNDEQKVQLEKYTKDIGGVKKFRPAHLYILYLDLCEYVAKLEIERTKLMKQAEDVVSFGVRLADKARSTKGIRGRLLQRKDDSDPS